MARVFEASRELRRCCRALADSCCARQLGSESSTECCTTKCHNEHTPLLGESFIAKPPSYGYATPEALAAASCAKTDGEEAVMGKPESITTKWTTSTLVITGMDCIDCLNKIKRAFRPLRGARSTSMDYMRALIEVEYDPGTHRSLSSLSSRAQACTDSSIDITDPEAVAIFISRATGFGAIVLSSEAHSEQALVEFTLQFSKTLPPRQLLTSLGARSIRRSPKYLYFSRAGGTVDFALPGSREKSPAPRRVFEQLKPSTPTLVARSNRYQAQATRDLLAVVIRALSRLYSRYLSSSSYGLFNSPCMVSSFSEPSNSFSELVC